MSIIVYLIKLGILSYIIYVIVLEVSDAIRDHREAHKWDEWERAQGSWDCYVAERGGVKGWVRKLDSMEVKTSSEIKRKEIVVVEKSKKDLLRRTLEVYGLL
jgi:hypothetical protein